MKVGGCSFYKDTLVFSVYKIPNILERSAFHYMRVIRCGVRKPVRYHSNFKSMFKLVSDKKTKMVRKVGDLIVKSSIRDFLTTI